MCAIIIVLTVVLSTQVINFDGREAFNPFVTKVQAASIVKSWSIKSIEKLSQTDAQIKARVNFNKSVKCTQAGFYFGTDKNNLKKNAKYDSISYTGTYLDMWFLMSKYGQKLKSDTTYYYKFYVVAGGTTYYSSVQSFKTKSYVKSWDIKSIEKLSKTDAQIKSRVNFNKSVKCTQAGFYFGTDKNNLKKNAKYDSISYTGTYLDMWFLMSKYGQKLSPGTTYYYKFYVVAEGKTYYSGINSFRTKAEETTKTEETTTAKPETAVVKSWSYENASKLSVDDAQIKATVNLSKSTKINQAGFYIGTSKDNLKKNSKPDTVNKAYTSLPMWYLMSKYQGKLTENTTYYYKFYITVDGKEYCSAVKSFKTKAKETTKTEETTTAKPKTTVVKNWSIKSIEKLSRTDAQIKSRVNFNKKVKCTQAGFYFGTDKNNLKKNAKYDSINYTGTYLDMWFLMSKYGQKLSPGTTYYYKFYVIAEGETYNSGINSFTTKQPASAIKSWSMKSVTKITNTNAQIGTTLTLTKSAYVEKVGFYLGKSKDSLKKVSFYKDIKKSTTSVSVDCLMSAYNQKLTPGTTYYYKFYAIVDGKEYCSSVKSFDTKLKVTLCIGATETKASKAKVKVDVKTDSKVKIKEIGFYIGTHYNDIKKGTKKINENSTKQKYTFKVSNFNIKLKQDTTYYYRAYAIVNGKTYKGNWFTFKTKQERVEGKPTDQVVRSSSIKVSDISYNNAKITYTETLRAGKANITEYGLYIGTSKDSLKKCSKVCKVDTTTDKVTYTYNVADYTELKENTTYYYQTYVLANDFVCKSSVKSFKTTKRTAATQLCFPLSTKYKWRASTYKGHGKAAPNGAAYSCTDIVCTNSTSKGKAVYAVEEGKVINRYDKDGRIVIKHTKKLTTTNGVTFSSYYSVYAHMSDIKVKNGDKVKRGQQIGKVSDKGLGNGAYHLHFQLSSAEKDAKWTSNTSPKLAISPYYVKGFVADYGKQSSYLKFDTGTYCNSRLWDHKPSK